MSVLILGGGVGGLVAATVLRKKLPDEHRIVGPSWVRPEAIRPRRHGTRVAVTPP